MYVYVYMCVRGGTRAATIHIYRNFLCHVTRKFISQYEYRPFPNLLHFCLRQGHHFGCQKSIMPNGVKAKTSLFYENTWSQQTNASLLESLSYVLIN